MSNCKPRRKFTGFNPALDSCPNKEQHTLGPEGYIDRSEWAQEMLKTHKNIRCSGCGLYAIWIPKPAPTGGSGA